MGTERIDLNELQSFVSVADSLSFTLAAQRLGEPKSSLSRAIRRLEGRLGVRLLERTTRAVRLTEAGELYLKGCRRMLEEAEQADLAVGALLVEPRGRLRVGAPLMFARGVIAPTLDGFLRRHPQLKVSVQLLDGGAASKLGALDVVIRTGRLEDSPLLAKRLTRVHVGLYASPEYLRRCGTPASPADLREANCVTVKCSSAGVSVDAALWRLNRGTELREVQVDPVAAMPDPLMAQTLAVAGVGVAQLSHWIARADLACGRLVRVLPDWEPDPLDLYALYSERLTTSAKVRVFLEYLRESLETLTAQPSGESFATAVRTRCAPAAAHRQLLR